VKKLEGKIPAFLKSNTVIPINVITQANRKYLASLYPLFIKTMQEIKIINIIIKLMNQASCKAKGIGKK
jgi:hypothetical protein